MEWLARPIDQGDGRASLHSERAALPAWRVGEQAKWLILISSRGWRWRRRRHAVATLGGVRVRSLIH